ncbi:MAG: divalent-cation tolerance protein CutA [Candidatus Aminicenantes bacterium]
MEEFILVLTTVPDEKTGQAIALPILEENLAACVTISGASRSLYWWKGQISKETEHILFMKTRATLFQRLEKKLQEVHPYDVPEIIALPIQKGSPDYLSWIEKETKG